MAQREVEPGGHYGHVTYGVVMGLARGATLCCHLPEILSNLKRGVLHFPLALDAANYVAYPEM